MLSIAVFMPNRDELSPPSANPHCAKGLEGTGSISTDSNQCFICTDRVACSTMRRTHVTWMSGQSSERIPKKQGRSNKRGQHEAPVCPPTALSDQDIAGAQEKSAGSVETRIYCGQVAECHCDSLTVAAKSSGIAPTSRASSGPPGARTTPPSSLPSTWAAAPDVCASDRQDCLWIIKPTLKIVPASKLKAPHRTCAVATSAALLLQMVAAPRAACRQITPHHAPANFAGKEPGPCSPRVFHATHPTNR